MTLLSIHLPKCIWNPSTFLPSSFWQVSWWSSLPWTVTTSFYLVSLPPVLFPSNHNTALLTSGKARSFLTFWIDAFELWYWRRLLRVPWTAKRSNQSILKEISPGISLEGMMLKLKLQYFGHLMQELTHWKRLWCWEGLGAEGEGDNRGWDGWMASLTRWTWAWVNSGSWWWTGRPGVLHFMGSQRVGHDWATELNIISNSESC